MLSAESKMTENNTRCCANGRTRDLKAETADCCEAIGEIVPSATSAAKHHRMDVQAVVADHLKATDRSRL